MNATYAGSALASYRESVTELIEAGEPWSLVEAAIDDISGISTESRDALWLMASVKHAARRRRTSSRWPALAAGLEHG